MSERIHLQNYYTETEGRKPNANDIKKGEIAINTADEILFMKNKNNEITEFIDKNAIQALIDENKFYAFNPEGTPAEEYAGLQDAVNNGKQVVVNLGATTPYLCTVQYEFYAADSYYVIVSAPYINIANGIAAVVYNAFNVSQTSIDFLGGIESPIILAVDDALNINSTNPVQNKVILEALGTVAEQANSKQAQLVSGTNIKTINGESILGSGNITIEGGETLTEADILAMGFTKNAGTITSVSINGTAVATSGDVFLPTASTSKYGVTKLSSATNSTSTTVAATPSAVKAAYDLANSKVSWLDQDMIYANGFEDESGELYITPSAYAMGYEGTILATQSYVDDAVENVSDYTITSFTKTMLDNVITGGSAITISTDDYNVITANTKTVYINNGGSGGRCILTGWNLLSSTSASLEFLCDGLIYICGVTIRNNTTKITSVKNIGNMQNVTHSSLTIYANETYFWTDSEYATVMFSLQAPTNTNIANVFTVIIKNIAGTESAISFYTHNNTIVWANDNPPVLGGSDGGDTYGNYVEISIRYVDNKYLGTWTKFSAS